MTEKLLIPFVDFYQFCRLLDKVLDLISPHREIVFLFITADDKADTVDYEQLYSQFKSLQARSCTYAISLKVLVHERSPVEAALQFAEKNQMQMVLFTAAFLMQKGEDAESVTITANRKKGAAAPIQTVAKLPVKQFRLLPELPIF